MRLKQGDTRMQSGPTRRHMLQAAAAMRGADGTQAGAVKIRVE